LLALFANVVVCSAVALLFPRRYAQELATA
jgi:hypothetical protein